MMFRVVLFFVACVAACSASEDCMKLAHPRTMHCCKTKLPPPHLGSKHDEIKECFEKGAKPPSCDVDVCIAKKLGYAGAEDGTFDKKEAEAHIDEIFASNSEMAEVIKKECINGDLSMYPPPDACDLVKMKHCIGAHALLGCSEWSTDGDCAEVKDLVAKCLKA